MTNGAVGPWNTDREEPLPDQGGGTESPAADLGRLLERVTRIELALSAWEVDAGRRTAGV
jgi:hypothetical protein